MQIAGSTTRDFLHKKTQKKRIFWGEIHLFWLSWIRMGPHTQNSVGVDAQICGQMAETRVLDFQICAFLSDKSPQKSAFLREGPFLSDVMGINAIPGPNFRVRRRAEAGLEPHKCGYTGTFHISSMKIRAFMQEKSPKRCILEGMFASVEFNGLERDSDPLVQGPLSR